jgi:hypothetical protein
VGGYRYSGRKVKLVKLRHIPLYSVRTG